jgi:hypothetical protein
MIVLPMLRCHFILIEAATKVVGWRSYKSKFVVVFLLEGIKESLSVGRHMYNVINIYVKVFVVCFTVFDPNIRIG